jgi:hypothetical protein
MADGTHLHPSSLVRALKDQFSISTFVETGTLLGNTAFWACSHVRKVVSIEADQQLYQLARKNFQAIRSIDLRFGKSEHVLKEVLLALDKSPALFWLDAHWSGPGTAGESHECPLLDEIVVIDSGESEHIILIDDARLFVNGPPAPHKRDQWPSIFVVIDYLRTRFPNSYIAIWNDVIIRVPGATSATFERIMQHSLPH